MNIHIQPISTSDVLMFFNKRNCNVKDENFDFAIAVVDEENETRGAIAMIANGDECRLGHLYTDGTELVGSILYGCAWRAAKALGHKVISI